MIEGPQSQEHKTFVLRVTAVSYMLDVHDMQMCCIYTGRSTENRQGKAMIVNAFKFCLCVSLSRDYVDKMEEARHAREER